ncbi:MAG: hypothetical protein JJU45_12000 [Acidimicrobiia bacterium]|nr:hypothetical protein [Acidimicrobiia bacterium]
MKHPQLLIPICLMLALSGCGADVAERTDTGSAAEQPGLGEPAELNVAGADRIEIRHGGHGPGDLEVWRESDTVAELINPQQVGPLVESLATARFIDVGAVDYDLVPPDYQVGFYRGDELLERLGYYELISPWGEHPVPGRWVTDRWELLAVTEELPIPDRGVPEGVADLGVLSMFDFETPTYATSTELAAASDAIVVGTAGEVTVLGSSRVDGANHYRAVLVQDFTVDEVLVDRVTDPARARALESGELSILWNGPNPENVTMRHRLTEGLVELDPLGTGPLPTGEALVLFLEPSANISGAHYSDPVTDAFMVVGRWQGIGLVDASGAVRAVDTPVSLSLPGLYLDEAARDRLAGMSQPVDPSTSPSFDGVTIDSLSGN